MAENLLTLTLTIQYYGVKSKHFIVENPTGVKILLEDLLTLKLPHPKRANITFTSESGAGTSGCTFFWPFVPRSSVLHHQLKKNSAWHPERNELFKDLSISTLKYQESVGSDDPAPPSFSFRNHVPHGPSSSRASFRGRGRGTKSPWSSRNRLRVDDAHPRQSGAHYSSSDPIIFPKREPVEVSLSDTFLREDSIASSVASVKPPRGLVVAENKTVVRTPITRSSSVMSISPPATPTNQQTMPSVRVPSPEPDETLTMPSSAEPGEAFPGLIKPRRATMTTLRDAFIHSPEKEPARERMPVEDTSTTSASQDHSLPSPISLSDTAQIIRTLKAELLDKSLALTDKAPTTLDFLASIIPPTAILQPPSSLPTPTVPTLAENIKTARLDNNASIEASSENQRAVPPPPTPTTSCSIQPISIPYDVAMVKETIRTSDPDGVHRRPRVGASGNASIAGSEPLRLDNSGPHPPTSPTYQRRRHSFSMSSPSSFVEVKNRNRSSRDFSPKSRWESDTPHIAYPTLSRRNSAREQISTRRAFSPHRESYGAREKSPAGLRTRESNWNGLPRKRARSSDEGLDAPRVRPPPNPGDLIAIQKLTRELWDLRRQITAGVVREAAIIKDLRSYNSAYVPDLNFTSRDVNARLVIVQSELKEEKRLRMEAEEALKDMERECREPFVVPALLDAFISISKATTNALESDSFK